MMPITRHIAVLNRSTVASDEEIESYVEAIQHQITYHYAPKWGTNAKLFFVGKDSDTGWEGKWNIAVLDTSDEATALGYHDYTPEGEPVGKAFFKTDDLYGASRPITLDHEILEMLGDPNINLVADDGAFLYAYENCDAVERDDLGYLIGETPVSDFLYPTWFVSSLRGRTDVKYDRLGHVTNPFEVAPDCHFAVSDTFPANWQIIWGRKPGRFELALPVPNPETRPRVGSRRERRRTPRWQWRRSDA